MKHVATIVFLAAAAATPAAAAPAAPFDLQQAITDGPTLSAPEAAARALTVAPSRASADARVAAAEASLDATRTGLFPRLELGVTYQHVDGFEDGTIDAGPTTVSIAIPRDRFGASARLVAPITDIFLGVRAAIRAERARVRTHQHEREVVELDVQRLAYESYFALVRARGQLAVARASVDNARAQLEQVGSSVDAGYLLLADRLAAEARVQERRQALANAEANVTIANATLRSLLDLPPGPPFGVQLDEVEVPSADVDAALARRPELDQLRAAAEAQGAGIDAAGVKRWPRLVLQAGADYARPNRYQIPPQDEFTPSWEVGAVLSWAPNDWWQANKLRAALEHERRATLERARAVEQRIRIEVVRESALVTAARISVDATRSAESAATAAYDERRAAMVAGETTTADLFAAEDLLHRARLAHLFAQVDLRLAAYRLRLALADVTVYSGSGAASAGSHE